MIPSLGNRAAEGSHSIRDIAQPIDVTHSVAIVAGNEVSGVDQGVMDLCRL